MTDRTSPETETFQDALEQARAYIEHDVDTQAPGWRTAQAIIELIDAALARLGYAPRSDFPNRDTIYAAAKEGNLAFWRASAAQTQAYHEWKSRDYEGECAQKMNGTIVDYITDAVLAAIAQGPDTSTDRALK